MSKRNPRPPGVPAAKPIDNPEVFPPDHTDQFPGDEDGPIVAPTPDDAGAVDSKKITDELEEIGKAFENANADESGAASQCEAVDDDGRRCEFAAGHEAVHPHGQRIVSNGIQLATGIGGPVSAEVIAEADRRAAEMRDAPPIEDFKSREIVERSEVMNPDPEAHRWLKVDTERMTGVVPHLSERGGMGPTEECVVLVNEQITSCPYYDPGDGIWGGVDLGGVVAYFPAGMSTWTPAVVVELFNDAAMRVGVLDQRYVDPKNLNPRVPHQAKRKPGQACWAHRSEDFTTVGRMAAELELGLGGAAWEEEQTLLAQPTPSEGG